jgi:ribulose-phosphate 3-epimerase
MPRITPAILVQDENAFRRQVSLAAAFAPAIQLDAMDGTMVPERSFSDPVAVAKAHLSIAFGVHLMANGPEEKVKRWIAAGAANVIIHVEAEGNTGLALERIRHAGRKAGLAINPDTDLVAMKDWAPFVDIFQVMGVRPGGQGRDFDAETPDRVRALKRTFPHIEVLVDGGVSDIGHIARKLAQAGADELVVGSALWRSPDPAKAYRDIAADAQDRG